MLVAIFAIPADIYELNVFNKMVETANKTPFIPPKLSITLPINVKKSSKPFRISIKNSSLIKESHISSAAAFTLSPAASQDSA
jgi:hypothetical protein